MFIAHKLKIPKLVRKSKADNLQFQFNSVFFYIRDLCITLIHLISLFKRQIHYLCDFVVRDIKIAVYLESPGKISFNLVNDFLSK